MSVPLDYDAVIRRARPVLGVLAVTAVLGAIVQAPLAAGALRLFLGHAGRTSVGNFEIAGFLLSPVGIALIVVSGTLLLAAAYLELAALLEVLGPHPPTFGSFLARLPRWSRRTLRLGVLQWSITVLLAAPLVLAALVALKTSWAGRDVNGLLVLRPPEFWRGLVLAGVPLLLLAILLVYLALRWLLALPLLVADPALAPRTALRESARRTRGRHGAHLGSLAVWAVATFAVVAGVGFALRRGAAAVLGLVGSDVRTGVVVTAVVLTVAAGLLAALSGLALASLAARVSRLAAEAGVVAAPRPDAGPRKKVHGGWILAAGAVAAVASTLGISWMLVRDAGPAERVEVTAHRAGAVRGPENSLAALRLAVEDGADWAEIDVQRAKDDALVILHDFDLARVGGGARRVRDATGAEIRALDLGAALGMTAFAGERIPTLEEVVAAAKGRIRLNIELKAAGPDDVAPLTDAVLAVVRREGLVESATLCSQSYEAMQRAKAAEPRLRVGWIAGASLGDVTKLAVDFLMLSVAQVDRDLVDRAHARGMLVYAWTVNDPAVVPRLVDLGVDNVITDRPAAIRDRLREVGSLSTGERVLLRARHALGR